MTTPRAFLPLTIVADDLTGACDTGALFAGSGAVPVTVWPASAPSARVRAIDTESRSLEAGEAARRIRTATGRLKGTMFKKIGVAGTYSEGTVIERQAEAVFFRYAAAVLGAPTPEILWQAIVSIDSLMEVRSP